MPKQPQDHQKPATDGPAPFTFEAGGKTYTLPLASEGRSRLTGRDLRNAAVDGEVGQLAYLFKTLEAANPDAETLDALYDMPQSDMLGVLQAWGDYGDGDGATLGE